MDHEGDSNPETGETLPQDVAELEQPGAKAVEAEQPADAPADAPTEPEQVIDDPDPEPEPTMLVRDHEEHVLSLQDTHEAEIKRHQTEIEAQRRFLERLIGERDAAMKLAEAKQKQIATLGERHAQALKEAHAQRDEARARADAKA